MNRRYLIAPLILCLIFLGVVGTSCALLDEDAVLVTKVIDGDTLEIKERKEMGSKGRKNVKKPKKPKEKKK